MDAYDDYLLFDADRSTGKSAWANAEDSEFAFPNLPAPRRVTPRTVRRRIRAVGGDRVAVGEIVPSHQAERGLGQLVRRKEQGFRTGPRALVVYDPRGNVYLRVYSSGMNPASGWQHIGAVTTSGLPSSPQDRGVEIEARIRQLVARATGIAFRPKSGRARGPDLLPDLSRYPSRSRKGVGMRRFDEFEMFDLEPLDQLEEFDRLERGIHGYYPFRRICRRCGSPMVGRNAADAFAHHDCCDSLDADLFQGDYGFDDIEDVFDYFEDHLKNRRTNGR